MARKSTQQSLASWIFGGVSFLFLIGVFCFAPAELPEAKHRILGLFAALCAAFLGYFLTGSIGIDGTTTLKPFGRFSIKAAGGLALFVLVLFWWNSDQSPSKVTNAIKKVEGKVEDVGNIVKAESDRQRRQIDEVIRAVADLKSQSAEQKLTDAEIWDQAKRRIASKNGIALEKLETGFDLFIAAVKADPKADFMDRARVDFAEKRFAASAENAGRAAETSEEKFRAAEKLAAVAEAEMKTRLTEVFQARKQQGLAFVAAGQFEQAVEAYRLGIRKVTREQLPEGWAELQFLLGEANSGWAAVSEGSAIGQRRREAVKAYRLALEVGTREALPQAWATTQNSLATALRDQAITSGGAERARLLEEAVLGYRQALEVCTREALPHDWAMIQNNLAIALHDQGVASGGAARERLLGEAVKGYRLALAVYTREALPRDWAMTQSNLAIELSDQAAASEGADRARLLSESVKASRLALEVYTREALPRDWAITQNNLARALDDQAAANEGPERERLLDEAVKACRLALEIETREASPQDWAGTQSNLAILLGDQAAASEGAEQARLLGESVNAYRQALEVYTREALPQPWARMQSNLAIALGNQAAASKGAERARLQDESVKAYRLALEVRTREALPQEWAATQNNLAIALHDQAAGSEEIDRVRLLGESVQGLRNAMQVLGPSRERRGQLSTFLGHYAGSLMLAHRPIEAAHAAEEALDLAPGKLWIVAIRAHGYLLGGEFGKAVEIYRTYATKKLDDETTFAHGVLNDFAKLRKAGIDHPDMAKIEEILKVTAVDGGSR